VAIWLGTFAAAGVLTLILTRLSPAHLERLEQLPLPVYIFVVNGLVPIVSVSLGALLWGGRGFVYAALVYKFAFLLYFTSTWPFQVAARLFPKVFAQEPLVLVVGTVAIATAMPAAAAHFLWQLPRQEPHELRRPNRLASLGLLVTALLVGLVVEVFKRVAPIHLGTVPLRLMPPDQLVSLAMAGLTVAVAVLAMVTLAWFYLTRMQALSSDGRVSSALGWLLK
jgi:hypothetical protein